MKKRLEDQKTHYLRSAEHEPQRFKGKQERADGKWKTEIIFRLLHIHVSVI